MRTLCVAGVYPWPAEDGYRLRLANMLRALADLGEVDFLCATRAPLRDVPPPPFGMRVGMFHGEQITNAAYLFRWVRSGLPRSQVKRSFRTANQSARRWLDGPYDLAYLSHISSWTTHRDLLDDLPVILDLDNLEHLTLRAARRSRPASADPAVWLRWAMRQPADRFDERRMELLQLAAAASVDAVTLCSALDVERSGMRNAVVVGNGYDRVAAPPAQRSGARMLFVGALGYPPNADAVRWFARDVLPLIRRHVPDATFRVVGGGESAVSEVAGLAGVEIAGRVADLQQELDSAVIEVVPLRSGSGTRLKVIEALANRLPMASTRLGVEGIDVADRSHVLIGDSAEQLAAACVELLGDVPLRRRLAAAGEALWDDRYRWSVMRDALATLAERVVEQRRQGAA